MRYVYDELVFETMVYPKELRETAQQMRRDGQTVEHIAAALDVAKSTISLWVRGIILTHEQVDAIKAQQQLYGAQHLGGQANRVKFRALRQQYQEAGRQRARLRPTPLHLMGCMLYWAEGAKHRSNFYFANSDPEMQRVWVRFLMQELGVHSDEIAIHLLLHTKDAAEIQAAQEYWLTVLQLPATCLRKPVYKTPGTVRKNKLPHGVCGIRVGRVDLVQHVFGAIQEYAGIDKPDWLD